MAYELLWDCFVPNDFVNVFDYFLKICKHVTHGHVPPLISRLFVALWLLALDKQVGGVWSIVIREVIYQLVTHTLAI